jgi:hypothetical protein
MEADDVVEEDSGKFGSCGRFIAGNEVAHFGEAINNYEDGVVSLRH